MTPDKGHEKNLVKSSPFRKYPIIRRKKSEPHGSKTLNTELDNYFTECSHDEENIEFFFNG